MAEVRVAHRRRHLRGDRGAPAPEGPGRHQLVLDDPGVVELGKPVGHFVHIVVLLEEQLVLPFPSAVRGEDDVEVQGGDVVVQVVFRHHQHLAAVDGGDAHIGERQQFGIAPEHGRGADRADTVVGVARNERARVARRQAGGERVQVGETVAVDIELPVRNVSVPVRVQRQRPAGHVKAMIDQVLGQPVPSGVLVARIVVVHAAKLDPHLIVQVHVERRLRQALIVYGVPIVAVGILKLGIEVVPELLAPDAAGPADLRGRDALVPASRARADGACCLADELAGFLDPGGLGIEVQVPADLGGTVDGRSRPAHDVDAAGCADGRWVVAWVVQPPNPAEVRLAGGAPDIQGPRDAEEGLRESARRHRDQFVDVAHVEAGHHLLADGGGGPGRVQQRLAEAEHGLNVLAGQAAEVADDHDFLKLLSVRRLGDRSARPSQRGEKYDLATDTHGLQTPTGRRPAPRPFTLGGCRESA